MIKELGRLVPYGIDNPAANTGWVSVGMKIDTSAFAVQAIRSRWQDVGPGDDGLWPLLRPQPPGRMDHSRPAAGRGDQGLIRQRMEFSPV